jgi:hypothetical protein
MLMASGGTQQRSTIGLAPPLRPLSPICLHIERLVMKEKDWSDR